MNRRNKLVPVALMIMAGGFAGESVARVGFSGIVSSQCSAAGRPAPVIAADDCSTCHATNRRQATNATRAYRSGGSTLLNYFCPAATSVNHAPTLSVASNAISIGKNKTVAFAVTASDQDAGDTITLAADLADVSGATFNATTGLFQWIPSVERVTPYSVTFTATDKAGLKATTVVAITVSSAPVNAAPVLTVPVIRQNVTLGQTLSFQVKASDTDGDDVRLTATDLPSDAALTAATQDSNGEWISTFSWTPTALPIVNPTTVTFTATDVPTIGGGVSALATSKTVTIAVNDAVAGGQIRAIKLSKVLWNDERSQLTVAGNALPLAGKKLPSGLIVTILDAVGGQTLGSTATIDKKGRWLFVSPTLSQGPCQISATIGGVSASADVKRAPELCHADDDEDSDDDRDDDHREIEHRKGDDKRRHR